MYCDGKADGVIWPKPVCIWKLSTVSKFLTSVMSWLLCEMSVHRSVQSQRISSPSLSAACVWSVCVARKAPLVASDSSSSSSSDSDEEEGKTESVTSETVTKETITTGAGKETIRLTMDAKNERAVFSRYTRSHSSDLQPSPTPVLSSALVEPLFPFPL